MLQYSKSFFLFRLLGLVVFVVSCQPAPRPRPPKVEKTESKYKPRRLTLGLINEFNLTDQELRNLRYYLENTLILQEVNSWGKNTVTRNSEVDLKRTIRQYEIVIEHMTKGTVVAIQKGIVVRFGYSGNSVARIQVQFEERAEQSLVFVPNYCGEFVVDESWLGTDIIYERRKFKRLYPSIENYLLFDAQLLEEIIHTRRIVRGMYGGTTTHIDNK